METTRPSRIPHGIRSSRSSRLTPIHLAASVISAAAATVLARFFGDHTSFTLSTGSGEANGVAPRTYRTFFDAAEENAASRVWLGYHFPISVHIGTIQGRLVATFVLDHILRAARDDRDNDDGPRH